jgi:predicted NBD/HSP70 family sugar kinase
MATPEGPKRTISRLVSAIGRITAAHPERMFDGIGVSLPGRFHAESRRLIFAPNLRWPAFDLKTPIESATGLAAEFENAANACVLSEVWFGQPDGVRDMAVVTVSEGIGAGILANGRLVRGVDGMAGEFGHIQMDPAGPECQCGQRGCWEMFASNRAALRYYTESQTASGLEFSDLLRLAEQGDARALKAFDTVAVYLGRGLRMIAAGLAPEAIVIVGEFTKLWERVGPVIEAEVAAQTLAGRAPRVTVAPEGQTARLRGTIALFLQKHLGDGLHAR